jgi:hypothetical protein
LGHKQIIDRHSNMTAPNAKKPQKGLFCYRSEA